MKVLLDANVLFPPTLRDVILCLADVGILNPFWTEEIVNEWQGNVKKLLSPLQKKALAIAYNEMTNKYPYALISGYEFLIEQIKLKDENDKHVAAAAIHGKVDFLITFNTKDFPKSLLRKYNITPIHPDKFFFMLIKDKPEKVNNAIDTIINLPSYKDATKESIILALKNRGLIKSMRML